MNPKNSICLNLFMILSVLNCSSAKAESVNAVVLEETNDVNVSDGNSYTWTLHREVMINNASAKRHTQFSLFMNDDTALSKFQITISDKNGGVLRTIKQKDLQRTELSDGLASDGYYYYVDFTPSTYPVITTLDMKVDFKRNNLSMPRFNPLGDYNTSVAHASYNISYPQDAGIGYHCLNCDIQPIERQNNGRTLLTFEMSNLPVVENSSYSRPLSQVAPTVYFKPRKATYYKTECDLNSWNAMGKWMNSLWEGRDELPPEAVAKVKMITRECHDNDLRGKVGLLYNYLAQNTRYVSIQLGIGGYQPMKAADVWRLGYGDCKALSNYMKALLKAADIESHCLSISTDEDKLLSDFPNFQQMDHVILEVPAEKDTIWLECTNPQLPLGYIPSYLSGHEALEITSSGGRVVTLPEYPDSVNRRISDVHITLSEDGSADLAIKETYVNHLYYRKSYLAKMDDKELRDLLLKQYLIPQGVPSTVEASDDSQPFSSPSITTLWKGKSYSYSSITGSRLFVPSTPLHKGFSPGTDSHVSDELYIRNGFCEKETVVIDIPDGYEAESLPTPQKSAAPFGSFTLDVRQEGKQVILTTWFTFYRGVYPDGARQLNEMEKMMASAFAKKLILKRNEQ